LEQARTTLQQGLNKVNLLRAYDLRDVQTARDALNRPAASGRTLDQILDDLRALLKPERSVVEDRALLDDADTYAEKARSAYSSVQDSFQTKDFYGVKIDIERLTVGF